MAAGAEGRVPWVVAAGLMAAVAVASLGSAAAATRHVVGGTTGWTIPPNSSFYSDWSSAQSFAVGDTLGNIQFLDRSHNVIKVPKSSYDACSATGRIGSIMSTGPATVTVASPGDHYYICGVTGHCSIGQKLAISVASTTSAPSTSPPGEAPHPTAGAPTTTSLTAPAPTGSGSGNPSSSAPALPSGFTTAAGFSLAMAALSATAFLL